MSPQHEEFCMKNFIVVTLFPFSVAIGHEVAPTEAKMDCYSRIVDEYWQCVDQGVEITRCDVQLLDDYSSHCAEQEKADESID